jgi:hypothetical protein
MSLVGEYHDRDPARLFTDIQQHYAPGPGAPQLQGDLNESS